MAITYNGVGTESHASNNSTTPGLPTHASGDLLVVLDLLRATAETSAVTGYTQLATLSNTGTRITAFGKIDGGAESGPTVTVSGTAGSHSSVMLSFDGTATNPATAVHASASAASGTGDNTIDYPALTITEPNTVVLLILGFNNDDDTAGQTFDTPAGFTQVGEYHTSLGADQTIVVYYQIQTTATSISAGTVTRTAAGATAVSGALILSILPAAVAGHPASRRFGRRIIGVENVRIY